MCVTTGTRQHQSVSSVVLYLTQGLVSALGELFTTNLDKDGLDKIINLLAVDEHIRVDEKLFIAIAAFTERVLCPRPA